MPGLKRWGFFTPPATTYYRIGMIKGDKQNAQRLLTLEGAFRPTLAASCLWGVLPIKDVLDVYISWQRRNTHHQWTCERFVWYEPSLIGVYGGSAEAVEESRRGSTKTREWSD